MTRQQRDEFWQRFRAEIERCRESGANCDVAVNPLEVRLWDVKFTRRRVGHPVASVTLAILEHAPSRKEFLLAVTPTYTVDDVVTGGERFLIPVFFDPASGTFLLHADDGPVQESHMTDFFARTADELLNRLWTSCQRSGSLSSSVSPYPHTTRHLVAGWGPRPAAYAFSSLRAPASSPTMPTLPS